MSAVHEGGEPLVDLARPLSALEYCGVDSRVDIEKEAPEPGPPVLARIGKHVCHGHLLRETAGSTAVVLLANWPRAGQGVDAVSCPRKVNGNYGQIWHSFARRPPWQVIPTTPRKFHFGAASH